MKARCSEDRQHSLGESVSCRRRCGEVVRKREACRWWARSVRRKGGAAPYISPSTTREVVRERINKKEWTATDSGREEGWVRRPKEPGTTLLRPSQQIGGSPACRHSLRGLAHTPMLGELPALRFKHIQHITCHVRSAAL